jgi:hypothetical protein
MPVTVEETEEIPEATPASDSEGLPRLTLTEEDLTSAIVSALHQRGFADVRVLTYPADSSAFQTKTDDDQFEAWLDQARGARADLLLRVKLLYEPHIEGEINEKFWLNLPLFLLGGPFCYFIDDRTYSASARLEAQFYSATAPRNPSGRTDQRRAAVLALPLQVEYTGSQLDFTDRAGRNVGAYALSLLVPAGLLTRNSEQVAEEVHDAALDELAALLLAKVATQQSEFNKNSRLASFLLDLERTTARRTSDGRVALSAAVRGIGQARLKRYAIRAGSSAEPLVEGDLTQASGPEHQIESQFSLPATESLVQLEIEDGRSNRRSYTFRVEWR